ncbi:MAG: lipid asymmetry maintenance protein MlaB [Lysobacterales bacterium]
MKLPDSLKIDALADTRVMMDEALASGQSVSIDASEVASIDYCGIQLLLAFVNELKAHGLSLSWSDASEPLRAAASDLSVDGHLGL